MKMVLLIEREIHIRLRPIGVQGHLPNVLASQPQEVLA